MKSAAFTIEQAQSGDLHEMADMLFHSELGRKYYPTLQTLEEALAAAFGTDLMYLLKCGTETAGFIWFRKNGAFYMYPYLHMVFVREDYRKNGCGRKLLDFFEQYALNPDGIKKLRSKVFLVVGDWNTNAMKFYERSGYTEVGLLPGLFRKKVDEHLMMKECVNL